MVRQYLDLCSWGWRARVYYLTETEQDGRDAAEILHALRACGATGTETAEAVRMLEADALNCGMTYSNERTRRSVVVIGRADSAEEFASTYDHEKGHLAAHIAQAVGISPAGEEYQYLAGEIARQMFKAGRQFFCDCCRRKL